MAVEQTQVRDLYEQYKDGIFRYILSITKNPELAEDVLHDTFVKVLSGGVRCAAGKEQAWLYRIARNTCLDYLRKFKREQPCRENGACPDGRIAYIELISSLSLQEQEVVTLRIIGGLTHKEIGQVLGITATAAQKRYERAISILRKEDEHGTETA